MHLLTATQILLVDTGEDFMAQLGGNRFDLLDQRLRIRLQRDLLGTAVFGYCHASNQPLTFETVE